MSATAANITLIRGPRGHQNYCKPKRHYLVLAASHCKKELAIFPSPAGMSLTKLSLAGKKLNYSRPGRVWSVTSRLGTGKRLTLFYSAGASDQDVLGFYGCNFSWRFQWQHRRPWPTLVDRDIFPIYPLQFPPIFGSSPSPSRPFLVTGNKFIACVVAIIVHWCSCHQR